MESFGSTRSFNTLQIGLTGSIGMGKSTISNQLIKLGIPLFDADREVHRLYAPNGAAVEPIRAAFPDAIVDGAVDRNKLTAKIIEDPSALKTIEQIVHPLVVAGRENFYARACAERQLMVVYDIPLLFENITKYNVDYIVVATAAADVQRRRVLERPGMTEEKFQAILAKQVPDAAKRERADFLVHTDYEGYSEAKAQLGRIIEKIIEKNPMLWEEWKQCGLSEPVDDDG
jgi:dephospho-CoA kinase